MYLNRIDLYWFNMVVEPPITWKVFKLDNLDFGMLPANKGRRISIYDPIVEEAFEAIQDELFSDPAIHVIPNNPVRFNTVTSNFGDFYKIGLDSSAQSTMFKLRYVGPFYNTATRGLSI